MGYQGSLGTNLKLMLPEDKFGFADNIFTRHYLRLGDWPHGLEMLKQFTQNGTDQEWIPNGGKIGIAPAHHSSWGGNSGIGGIWKGWSMRYGWQDVPEEVGGPCEQGTRLGFHTWDISDPVALASDKPRDKQHGQIGGIGSYIYPGHWYCLECQIKLNSTIPDAPGWVDDVEMRAWLDGRLVFERIGGFALRTQPYFMPDPDTGRLRPCREMGATTIWFNWMHGGTFRAGSHRSMFVTGFAFGTEYIGPMKGVG